MLHHCSPLLVEDQDEVFREGEEPHCLVEGAVLEEEHCLVVVGVYQEVVARHLAVFQEEKEHCSVVGVVCQKEAEHRFVVGVVFQEEAEHCFVVMMDVVCWEELEHHYL